MNALLIASDKGIPLSFIRADQLDTWQSGQTAFVQNWLAQCDVKTRKLALIPDPQTGDLQQVVSLVDDLDDVWIAGDLAKALPKGLFQVQGDASLQERAALSFALGGYQFAGYREQALTGAQLAIGNADLFESVSKQVESLNLVRDLVNTPPVDMMPQHLSEVMTDLAVQYGGQFSEIIGDELLEQNYPTIHLVGRASDNKPRLLDLRWGDENAPKLTLVGKGVCFDSGGLDLKPSAGMRLMKKDMGGAAHVIGLANWIMTAGLNVRLRVLVPAVENAVSRNAFRPGDVVKTRKGLTVEIDNTDAEGRLVLCDALDEAQSEDPTMIIDFATLTGACRIALGTELPGFFSTHAQEAVCLMEAAEKVQDPVWQLPLFKQYKALLKSDVADMTNCATVPFGGAITAALYLQEFVDSETPWFHFDVMAWNTRALPGRPVGGEALGLRAMFRFLSDKYAG